MKPGRDHVTTGEEAESLRLLAGLSLFLARYVLEGPTPEADRVLADPGWAGEMARSGLLVRDPGGEAAPLEAHRRQWETTLRVPGDGFVPPFEQAYHEGKATTEFSAPAACHRVYARAGYQLEPYGAVQADHLGHQLRFLAALLDRLAECSERGDGEAAERVESWVAGFVRDRCWWWAEFAERVAARGVCRQLAVAAAAAAGVAAVLAPEEAQ